MGTGEEVTTPGRIIRSSASECAWDVYARSYNSVADFMAERKRPFSDPFYNLSYGKHSWDMGLGETEAETRALSGDTTLVPSVKSIIDKVAHNVAAVTSSRLEPDLFGSSVSVPDYLSGAPECMRRMRQSESSGLHVGVYVSNFFSAGVAASEVLARGAAVLAFLESLQLAGFSAELYMYCLTGSASYVDSGMNPTDYHDQNKRTVGAETLTVIKVESSPLDLSVSGFVIGHPAWTRDCFYGRELPTLANQSGPTARNQRNVSVYDEQVRYMLGMAPTDVHIGPMTWGDPTVTDPVAWVQKNVTQLIERNR